MREKKKVLFLAAYPDASPLKLDEEIRAITQKIHASEYRDSLELIPVLAVRPDDLLQALNEHKPHIVHFSGHGSPQGEIILVDETLVNGQRVAKPVSSAAIKALFSTLQDNVRIVVLNACYSRTQAEAIREIVDCVVGMNSAIGDQAAITFAASFYRALGFGRSVQEAFDQGRVALLLAGIPEENIPELLCKPGIDPSEVFLVKHSADLDDSTRDSFVEIPLYPYDDFMDSFREIVAPKRISPSKGVLHTVFGDISNIRYITPVIPINQSFDFWQRGPRSVLAKFEKVKIGDRNFFDVVEQIWPPSQRPHFAGIGHTYFLRLPDNAQSLPGVMLVVTTRDLGAKPLHYGRYVNTPIEGIEYALDQVLEMAARHNLKALALPLLGTGYANIGRTWNRPELEWSIREIVLALTIYKLEVSLASKKHSLERGVVVVYSPELQSKFEHRIWEFVLKFINEDIAAKKDQIDNLVQNLREQLAG